MPGAMKRYIRDIYGIKIAFGDIFYGLAWLGFGFGLAWLGLGPGPGPGPAWLWLGFGWALAWARARPGPSARALVKTYHLDKTPTTKRRPRLPREDSDYLDKNTTT